MFLKTQILSVLIILISSSALGQNIQALFSSTVFKSPKEGPYIETYLLVNGQNVSFVNVGREQYQAKINVTYSIHKGQEQILIDRVTINSPIINDTNNINPNFLDQQRFRVPDGDYKLKLLIEDLNSSGNPNNSESDFKVNFDENKINFSEIEMVDYFIKSNEKSVLNKNGFKVMPYLSTFYPDNKTHLKFYAELYGTNTLLNDSLFLIKYYIAKHENTQILNNYVGYVREKTAPVNVILREFNIERLKSGNYDLIIEARNKSNQLVAHQSLFFQRSNIEADNADIDLSKVSVATTFADKINNLDSIKEHIASLRPIADRSEQRFIDRYTQNEKDTSLFVLKKFFYAFWLTKNEFDPEKEWLAYKKKLQAVDLEFGTRIRKGYNTDRGITYLKYGKPNSRIEVPNEPNSYPYEIWHYFKINNQTNGKFIFWSTDNVTNDYELLHSTIFTEVRNPRWEMMLQQRNTSLYDLDEVNPNYTTGGRAREYWDNPR